MREQGCYGETDAGHCTVPPCRPQIPRLSQRMASCARFPVGVRAPLPIDHRPSTTPWRPLSRRALIAFASFPMSKLPPVFERLFMSNLLLRVCDFLLLAGAAALFGAGLTSLLTTGAYGWVIPDAPYMYGPRDFAAQAVLAGLAGVLVLVVMERLRSARRTRARPGAAKAGGGFGLRPAASPTATFCAALVALYLAPPDPIVFGNTWAPGEATMELFLAQWPLVLPLALAVTVLRWGLGVTLRRALSR